MELKEIYLNEDLLTMKRNTIIMKDFYKSINVYDQEK